MGLEQITPELIVTCLNILILFFIVLGFLIGFLRGTFKSIYRFIVTLIIILGCWSLLSLVTSIIMEVDIRIFVDYSFEGYTLTTVKDAIEFVTKVALGFITREGAGWTTYTGNVVITETMLYGLLFGLVEMVLRVVLLVVLLLVLNIILKIIFGIVYIFVKPKKKDSEGNKIKKKLSSRLIGGFVGTVNMIVLMLIIAIPLAGVFSIADDCAELVAIEDKEKIVQVSLGKEVIRFDNLGLNDITINNLNEWTSIYRDSALGKMFSIKIGGTEIDNKLYDSIFHFQVNGESIAIRKEINVCTKALGVVKEEIIVPVLESQTFDISLLDSLSSEMIVGVFTELGELKIVNIVVPVGIESGLYIIQNNENLTQQYASIVDIIENIDITQISISDTLVQVGNFAGSLYDLFLDTGYKPTDIIDGNVLMADIMEKLFVLDPDKVENVFNALADITLIDTFQEIAFITAEDYIANMESVKQYTVMLPKISISNDGYYVIKDTKTNVPANLDIDNTYITVNENKCWVINGVVTEIDASENFFEITLKGIKITDEIRNMGSVYRAFQTLGISSISEIQAFISGGPDAEGSMNLDKCTYENFEKLFASILNFKTVQNVKENVYVVINNIGLPTHLRETIVRTDFTAGDLASIVCAAKVLAETGVIWDSGFTGADGSIDYLKLSEILEGCKDEFVENLLSSKLVTDNINPVANAALKLFLPTLELDLTGVDWAVNGKEELGNILEVATVVLKHMDKITTDISLLSENDIDEISQVLIDNMSKSELLKKNMNNFLNIALEIEAVKNLGLVIRPIDENEWTENELKSIFESLKICAKMLTKNDDGTDKNILLEALKLTETDVNTLLGSKFIVTNLVANLCELSKEGGSLYELVVVNLSEDDPSWYDTYKNDGTIETKGEVRKILTNAIKLIEGVENFEDTSVLIEKAVLNLSKLSNNIGSTDDEVGELLSSQIISDTLVYHIQNIELEILIIDGNIVWTDVNNTPGELRNIISAAVDLLIDEDGNVIYNDLISGETEKLAKIFLGIEDAKIENILNSKIVLDTIVKFIVDLSVPSADREFTIYLKDIQRSDQVWREEITKIIKGAKAVVFDEDGNLISLDSSEEEYIQILIDIEEENVEKLIASDILVDTIADVIIKLADEENSFLSVSSKFRTYDSAIWRAEIRKIINSGKELLLKEDGTSAYSDLIGDDNNKKLEVLANVENIDKVIESEIIVDTIAKVIIDLGDGDDPLLNVSEKVKAFSTQQWGTEIKNIIEAIKVLLIDEDGNIDIDVLNGTNDEILTLIAGLHTEETTEHSDEIKLILASEIIYETLVKTVKDLAKEDGAAASLIKLPSDIDSYSKENWEYELKNIIKSVNLLLADEEGNINSSTLNSGNTNDLLQLVVDLSDGDLDVVLSSNIIYTTIISQIIEFGKPGGDITLDLVKYNMDTDKSIWTDEIKNMIASVKLVLTDNEGNVNIDKINENVNELLKNVISLNSAPNTDNDELGTVLSSDIICDTIITKIKEQDKANGGALVISESIIWKDVKQDGVITITGELRHLFESVNVLYKDSEIDIENIETNDLLNKVRNLNNEPNGENDEVGILLSSKILSDTIIVNIINEDESNGGMLSIAYTENSPEWVDSYTGNVITSEGELRLILAALPVVFKGDIDLKDVSANSILELTDNEVDIVLESKIFSDTIEKKITELDGKEDLVVNPITDLNSEVKALIKGAKIILADAEGKVDLDNPNFNIEKILELTETEQDDILNSQIIVDTVKAKLISLGEGDEAILVVNENITDWKAEIKHIINNSKTMLKADPSGKYLTSPEVNYESIYNMDEEGINKLLKSQIITDTIIIALMEQESIASNSLLEEIKAGNAGFDSLSRKEKNQVIISYSIWKDIYEGDTLQYVGEVHRVLSAATKLVDGEDFNIDKLKTISETDLETVFDSRLMLDTFYKEMDELSNSADPVVYIKETTVRNKDEAVKFVKAIQVVLGENDITTIDSNGFNFDEFINKTNDEIALIVASEIISFSASKKVYSVLSGEGALANYVELEGANESEKLDTISLDLGNLLKVIRDLKAEGIDYNNFSFESFMNTINASSDSTAKADEISDIMVTSNILVDSLPKMMGTILEDTLDNEMMDLVDLNVGESWLDNDSNGNEIIEDTEIGEFKRIMRLLVHIDKFTNESSSSNSNITDKDDIAIPLKLINNSKVLHGVVPKFMNTALANVEDWKYQPTDPLYRAEDTLTVAEWDNEIDVLSSIIAQVNTNNSIENLGKLDVKADELDVDSLGLLLETIALSRLLDISNIEDFVESAVNTTFLTTVTITEVYSGSEYDGKVLAWNGIETTNGEIDNLVAAIKELRNVNETDITDDTAIAGADSYQGVANARAIGKFLNACKESIMLEDVIVTIFNSYIPDRYSSYRIDSAEGYNLEDSLTAVARLLIMIG